MLAILVAAAMSGQAPVENPANVWLDCKWHEVWKRSSSFGSASSSDSTQQEYTRVYMFSPSENKLFTYQSDQTLLPENAVIGATAILVENQDNYSSLDHQSRATWQWVLSRQDLKVQVLGSSESETKMADGRIATTSLLRTGEGACDMIDPKTLAIPKPNKF